MYIRRRVCLLCTRMHPLPEELLARILALALPAHRTRTRIAPLLVSRQFFRIAFPLLYHTLHFASSLQATRALDTLTRHPTLAASVRRIVFGGIWPDSAGVLALCHDVQDIDLCLDGGPGDPSDVDAAAFCCALERRHSVVHLTIRKDPAVYLTHPRPVFVLQRLAHAVHHWTNLVSPHGEMASCPNAALQETVHFAFRISSSPSTLPLARALGVAPRLRSVRAQLPAVWNVLLLVIAANPSLEKVMLYAEAMLGPLQSRPTLTMGSAVIKGQLCDDIEHAVLGTGLYMMEAKKHARLSDLIKTGT